MTAAAMLSRESRRWGDCDDDDGEEEVVEVDDNNETTTTSASPPPAPSPPRRIHPPRPSSVSPVGGGGRVAAAATTTRTTWRCCTGGGWTSATPTPTVPMRWRGVVIDKLIPSLFSVDIIIFTFTKSEHSDSPWCEPITPLFLEIVRLSEAKKHACGRSIIHGGEDRRKVLRKSKIVY